MSLKQILKRIFCDFCSLILILSFISQNAISENLIEADNFQLNFPYTKTFIISAYYSPLPCQQKYVTGSYEGDIRLNGDGVKSADGYHVYPGMIAAPKPYPFGTKMYIPDVGIVSVHDRGGAIVSAGIKGHEYDRLDIWMGYGDKGLRRALNWGKKTLDVTVYGVNDEILEQISLYGYSSDESIPDQCSYPDQNIISNSAAKEDYGLKSSLDYLTERDKFEIDLKLGVRGNEVVALQRELQKLNLFKEAITGYYGELTEHAVYKFQQTQFLAGDEASVGAGIFGPKTRDRLNEIIANRKYNKVLIAQATTEYKKFLAESQPARIALNSELDFGYVGPEVKVLQNFLKEHGYFKGAITTDYFGTVTKEALIEFQLANNIIENPQDTGAGRVGQKTLNIINNFS